MKYTTGQILSVTTHRKLTDTMGEIYQILTGLTNGPVFTHELERAAAECIPWIEEYCPWVKDYPKDRVTKENFLSILKEAREKHGKEHEIPPVPSSKIRDKAPEESLAEMLKK